MTDTVQMIIFQQQIETLSLNVKMAFCAIYVK